MLEYWNIENVGFKIGIGPFLNLNRDPIRLRKPIIPSFHYSNTMRLLGNDDLSATADCRKKHKISFQDLLGRFLHN
jgi:hypothetical protein